ncbi:LysR family transcriptional regulator [Pelagibius litoralis]|uniref:LysR family transcriptional regulator n=1 Tax=Pelagibius litoralis TaxID=374515 RepID=A0A967C2P2_9PROT|nr:LysR family transcriptional regulator [Pelagibius litoralis]NIA67239.1 LysR family transcriptional regulator [Pelagibius litoralis]
MPTLQRPPVLFEMMKSLTTLGRTLNLSKTVATLGITRQTVRRHISTLESIKGAKFFEITDRQYVLTEPGRQAIREAERVLEQAEAWLSGHLTHDTDASGMDRSRYRDEHGRDFYAQQHPLSRLWIDGPPILQKGFLAWANARFQIESPELEVLKPYLLLYRQHDDSWLCVAIGEKSSYATWFDRVWAKSAIGRFSKDDPAGSEFNDFISGAHSQIFSEGGVRLDHVYAQIPRERGGTPIPVSFQRLLMCCTFPDGQTALAVLVARTKRLEIEGLDPRNVRPMPDDLLMEFDI